MNNKIFTITFLLSMSSLFGFSQQSMSDYSYIEVPEVYEFLEQKDQYQLNSLTKFLFNKNGFHAYFSNELPNVKKCDGLYASLETELGFIYTKIVVVVKDCNGVVLYRGAEGRSKLKDYKRTYHQALRNAFESFENLGVNQKELETDIYISENASAVDDDILVKTSAIANDNFPLARYSSYTHGGKSYLLRKTAFGYSLYQEVMGADDGLLSIGTINVAGSEVEYADSLGATSEAYFDKKLNLIVKLSSGDKVYALSKN